MSCPLPSDEEKQKSNWNVVDSYLESTIKEMSESTFESSFRSLLDVNIIMGQDILVRLILKYQFLNDNAKLYAALVARLNSIVPKIGATLSREVTALFIDSFNNLRDQQAFASISLLAQLFNYEVVHEIVILQVIHLLSEKLDESSISFIIRLLWSCGKHLSEVSSTAHNMIFEKLRDVLQKGRLSTVTSESLEQLFDLRRSNYATLSASTSLPNIFADTNTHTFMIDNEAFKPSPYLGCFKYHEDFLNVEAEYQSLKEFALMTMEKSNSSNSEEVTVARDLTGKKDIEFKKQFYLILKSSLSSDEAAHKILKLRIADTEKYRVVDIIVKSSIQEATYSKFYGLLAEKLCSSHKSWKPAFQKIFKENYEGSEEFEPAQLRTLGKFWGHVLASDFIGLEILENVHMGEDTTTAPGRIFLKFIFQEMVASLGIDELKERFEESYIQPYLKNIFPTESAENIRYSVNYFTAIGLGVLTVEMRKRLDIINSKEQVNQDANENQIGRTREAASNSRYRPSSRYTGRTRSITPPRRQRRTSVTPPRRTNRSRSPITRRR